MDTLTCDEVKPLLPGLAAGALDADERAVIDAHLSSCADCRAELAQYNAVAHGLTQVVPQHAPPAALRGAILAAARATAPAATSSARSQSWLDTLWTILSRPGYALVAAVAVVAVGLALIPLVTAEPVLSEAAKNAQIIAERSKAVAMRGTENAPAASATISIGRDDRSAVLEVANLPPLPAGKAYCAWLVYDGGKARDMGALFTVDEAGNAAVLIGAPRSLATYGRFTVTVEDAGSKPEKPTGPRVLSS
jgi:anti-sigma-K factor RskA